MDFETCFAGEGGLLLRFGSSIDPATNDSLLSLMHTLDNSTHPIGLIDILPSFTSLLIHFNPLLLCHSQVESWVKQTAASFASSSINPSPAHERRVVLIPVKYGGHHGQDLEDAAALANLSSSDVVNLHTSPHYRVYFLGFVGGFPYLGGLPPPLANIPRRSTPRQYVPKGTVAVAGGQTGIYPISSPGGWHCIGTTNRVLFNPNRSPPSLLYPGDTVKFVAVQDDPVNDHNDHDDHDIHDIPGQQQSFHHPIPPNYQKQDPDAQILSSTRTWIRILSPGPLTTVQDRGRTGYGRYGVSKSGAADLLSLRMGNSLLRNDDTSASLEVTLGGLKFTVQEECFIALTGADCSALLFRPSRFSHSSSPIPLKINSVCHLLQGDRVELGFAKDGMRAYVAVAGGLAVAPVLASRSTDLRTGLGGFHGRALQQHDLLDRYVPNCEPLIMDRFSANDPLRESIPSSTYTPAYTREWTVRVLPGPTNPSISNHEEALAIANRDFSSLTSGRVFAVLGKSDRMAVCLTQAQSSDSQIISSEIEMIGGQQMSEGCVSGTIQLPPDNNPVILLAEHQTTGGYKTPAVVIQADLWKVGQMRPDDMVKFVPTTDKDAVDSLHELVSTSQKTYPVPPSRFLRFPFVPRNGLLLESIDLNADVGEGYDDAGLLEYVTSVNVACGGHVGTPSSVARTVSLAVKAGAAIGAHPSFEDKDGFGRKHLDTPPNELRDQVIWQVSALQSVCIAHGTRVSYIKPHGALYHAVLKGGEQGEAVLQAAEILQLPLLLMPISPWASFGEGFAERAYDGDKLRSRDLPGAVIHDPDEAAKQAVDLASRPNLHTICVHGDSPNAVNVARAVRIALDQHFEVRPFAPPPSPFLNPFTIENIHRPKKDFHPNRHSSITPSSNLLFSRANFKSNKSIIESIDTNLSSSTRNLDELKVIEDTLRINVAPVIVNGYRKGQGVQPDLYPSASMCKEVELVEKSLKAFPLLETTFTRFTRSEVTFDEYIASVKQQLTQQGGGWVTVAPRDTVQQGNDSESASITYLSRRNAEVWAVRAGCVGYEIGGAQYQAGLIRGFDPGMILTLGLPSNLPGHSLQRSQYVNGLTELPSDVRISLFSAAVNAVRQRYIQQIDDHTKQNPVVPWFPYNFHAGNFLDKKTGRSPQDETTAELLSVGCIPIPVWVFSLKFPLSALRQWTERQIDIFDKHGQVLHWVRIKNPGQGKDWVAESIWEHVKIIIDVFSKKSQPCPIVYIHNHDFNGLAAHVGAKLFRIAQYEGFNYLVIDAAYRKNGTHNDNTVLLDALSLTADQRRALTEWNRNQQIIEKLLIRFNSRESQMTPWDSDWAGGTEGSDIRIAKEYGLSLNLVTLAKEIASEVFPLERAVTPFSEYKLRLGIAIMIEDGIFPKTAAATREWINEGGKLKVGGDVLVGLYQWETLVPKTPEVDKLLQNMRSELHVALCKDSSVIRASDLPQDYTCFQRFTALGFQGKGLDFIQKIQGAKGDLTCLLLSPHVLHSQPRTLKEGIEFDLLLPESDSNIIKSEHITFRGFQEASSNGIVVRFQLASNEIIAVEMEKENEEVSGYSQKGKGNLKANPANPNELGCEIPGELLRYSVCEGHTLQPDEQLCVLESMKMEVVICATAKLVGKTVVRLPLKGRKSDKKGDWVSPGDLLVEVK